MRSGELSFCGLIEEEALKNKDIYICVADGLEQCYFRRLSQEKPEQIVKCGISEQNQLSVANGLALGGKKVFCVMMSAFMVHRALDQLKMACFSNADIKFLGIAGDIALYEGGYSHIAIDDMAIVKNTPNLEIASPYTIEEEQKITKRMFEHNGPMFITIPFRCKNYLSDIQINEGGFSKLINGDKKTCIISCGNSINYLFEEGVMDQLIKNGVLPTLYSTYSIEPFDYKTCEKILNKFDNVITFELRGEGGLASCFEKYIARKRKKVKFLPIHLKNEKYNITGKRNYAARVYLDLPNLANKILKFINPIKLPLFKKKGKQRDDFKFITIKHSFLGLTYYKMKFNLGKKKEYILGFIPKIF